MRSVVLMLMVSATQVVQLPVLCPASCVVCSEEAIICSQLSSIIEVPASTKALLLTDGLIDNVDPTAFAELFNLSVLVLSNNLIAVHLGKTFQNLTELRTLFLDHNRLSSQSLDRSTFSCLYNLETLNLGHNNLMDINGTWFHNSTVLKTLILEGNHLSSMDSSSFALSDLRNLETLDLSENLIVSVGRESFSGLPRLRSLDLSRNRLQNMPDAFSHLSRLSVLNLAPNYWNCTCELQELASFLRRYVRSSGKVLYDVDWMMCTSADNPSVQTVLDLSEVNCPPPSDDLRSAVASKSSSSTSTQHYTRDVVLTAVFSCLGGVLTTLAVLALLYRILSKRLQEIIGNDDESSQASAQWHFSEDKEALTMSCTPVQPWNKSNREQNRTPDSIRNPFRCHNCCLATAQTASRREAFQMRPNDMRIQNAREDDWSDRGGKDQAECPEKQPRSYETHGAMRLTGASNHRHVFSRENPQPSAHRNTSDMRIQQTALKRDPMVAQRQVLTLDQNHTWVSHQHGCAQFPVSQTIQCTKCHQVYDYRRVKGTYKDSLPRRNQTAGVILYRDTLNYNPAAGAGPSDGCRMQKSITFDVSMDQSVSVSKKEDEGPYRISRTKLLKELEHDGDSEEGGGYGGGVHTPSKTPKPVMKKNKKLRVKLNLNPLKKCKVHPKSGVSHEEKPADNGPTERNLKDKSPRKDNPKRGTKQKKGKSDGPALKTPKNKDASQVSEKNKEHSRSKVKKSKTTKKLLHAEGSNDHDEPGNSAAPTLSAIDSTDSLPLSRDSNAPLNDSECKEDEAQNEPPSTEASHDSCEGSSVQEPNPVTQSTDMALTQPLITVTAEEPEQITKSDPFFNHDDVSQFSFKLKGLDDQVQSTEPKSDPLMQSSYVVPDMAMVPTHSMALETEPHPLTNLDLNLAVGTLGDNDSLQERFTIPQDSRRGSVCSLSPSISVLKEYLPSDGGSPKRKLRLVLPEKTSNRPPTALDKKIR